MHVGLRESTQSGAPCGTLHQTLIEHRDVELLQMRLAALASLGHCDRQ